MSDLHRALRSLCLITVAGSLLGGFPAFAGPQEEPVPARLQPPSGKLFASSAVPKGEIEIGRSEKSEQQARESAKLGSYLLWLDQMERERAALRDTGMAARSAAQAFERIAAFERATLSERPPRPEKLLAGHRFYHEALSLEASYSVAILQALRRGESSRARKLSRDGSKTINRRLEQVRRELSWYYRQRNLGMPPKIAPSGTGSYFGYLAGHAPH